jgi:hypothetical protein
VPSPHETGESIRYCAHDDVPMAMDSDDISIHSIDPLLLPLVKLHALHRSVVPVGVTVLLGLYNPPHRGCGERPNLGCYTPCVDSLLWYSICRGREAEQAT